ALQVIERRIVGRQLEGLLVRAEELLAPSVAVRPLGDGDEVEFAFGKADFFHGLTHGAQLSEAAVDQHEIGPGVGFAGRRRKHARRLASLSPKDWGRWIACVSWRDGGGGGRGTRGFPLRLRLLRTRIHLPRLRRWRQESRIQLFRLFLQASKP